MAQQSSKDLVIFSFAIICKKILKEKWHLTWPPYYIKLSYLKILSKSYISNQNPTFHFTIYLLTWGSGGEHKCRELFPSNNLVQFNRNAKSLKMRYISWNSTEVLLRYGNPDMLFMGTLKNILHFLRFLNVKFINMRIISHSGFLFDIKYYKIYQIWQPWKSKYYFSKKIIQNLSFTLKFAWYLLKFGK